MTSLLPRVARLVPAALLALGALALSATAQSRRIELADLGRIVRIADPQLSPDGKSVLAVVSRANYAQNRYDASLVIVDVASGAQRTVLTERLGLGSPRWSPKGDRIAFLSTGSSSATASEVRSAAQLFTVLPTGDSVTTVTTVTNAPRGVQQYAWRPDGGAFAYATADELAPRGTDEGEKFNDSFEIGNDDYLVHAAPTPTHIWLVSVTGGAARRLTSGSWSLPTVRPPSSPASPITWSPDGGRIAFAKVPSPHSGDFSRSTVHVIDVASGAITAPGGGERAEGYPIFSRDGKQLAFWYSRNGDAGYGRDAFVVPLAGGMPRNVTQAIDRNMARTFWSADGRSLLVGANDDRRVSLWQVPLDGGSAPRKLDLDGVSPNSSFWVDMSYGADGAMAFVGTTPTRPAELYYMTAAGAKPRRLTDLNAEVAGRTLGRTESVDWTSPDGVKNNGTLTYPVDFDPSKTHPLVLVIHGGPRAATSCAGGVNV
jgi:dipeptidyl aminopeptidase/acylaminoacyl peptidase